MNFAEYIWLDGTTPTQALRSKMRVVSQTNQDKPEDFPKWSFDGSSTGQAKGGSSDCLLIPVCVVADPVRGDENSIVLCEVNNADDTPHPSNMRAKLRNILEQGGLQEDPWLGFEQEYTLFKSNRPLGWPKHGYPGAQGPYYCGVGAEQIFGREIAEEHAQLCMDAGLMYYGLNAEVMPGQWEFQIGYRGLESDTPDALTISDHMIIARWLLHLVSEDYDVHVSFDNKPIKGDWNGAGMHTNFSTISTRNKATGKQAIDDAIRKLQDKHLEHVAVYGFGLDERLTGLHETCDINTFKAGVSDRGSSIRIPAQVAQQGYGYLEDRRPGANANPYEVASKLIATICDIQEQ
jgi:glutamine synthetase